MADTFILQTESAPIRPTKAQLTVDAGVVPQPADGLVDGHQLVDVVGVVELLLLRRASYDVSDEVAQRRQLTAHGAHLLLYPVVARRAVCTAHRPQTSRARTLTPNSAKGPFTLCSQLHNQPAVQLIPRKK